MARVITMRQLSGAHEAFELLTDMTLREFKRQPHGWLPCADESKRSMSCVELVVGDKPLLNNDEMVSEAIPGTEVLAFLSIKPVICKNFSTSDCDPDDFRVVEIPSGTGNSAFEGCIGKSDHPKLRDCDWTQCLPGCSSLASLAVADSVNVIGTTAFEGCISLESVPIRNSVTEIPPFAFKGCSSLASLTLPNSAMFLSFGAFQGCACLTIVAIPNSVTQIGTLSFAGCSSLTSVAIPNSIIEIGDVPSKVASHWKA
ncbi:unnamed protein product [Effrenium voratum]|uniref:Uncharacterized protein n=1 Tax=Effrenium voratum TaxID=2562239 RepID=A0AA36NF39_9DINO|nr:unnamed protein product [Effrenium voratum]